MMRRYKRLIFLLSILAAFICLVQNTSSERIIVALLPLSYGIASQLLPSKLRIGSGLAMMSLVLFIRYLIYPLLFHFQDLELQSFSSLNSAVIFMVIEQFVIILCIIFFVGHNYHEKGVAVMKPMSSVIPFLMFLLSFFIIVRFPEALVNRHSVFNTSDINQEIINVRGFYTQPIMWGEIIIVTYLFNLFSIKYLKTKMSFWYLLAVAVLLFRCLFYSGHSRISLLIPFVTTVFVLVKSFGEKSKFTVLIIMAVGLVSLALLSAYKLFETGNGSEILASLDLSYGADSINEYFGGVKNVLHGLYAYETNGPSLRVFLNDTFRNVMGLSSFFEPDPVNSVTIFNTAVYRSALGQGFDQICPTIIEGMLMFGKPFFFIPTVIMTYVCCLLDDAFYSTTNIGYAYLFAACAALIGWAIPGNYMHMCGIMFNTFIPIFILLKINERIKV